MRHPERFGGSGASAADVLIVAEALGRAPGVVPFAGPVLAAELLMRSDLDGQAAMALAERSTVVLAPAVVWDAAGSRQGVAARRERDGGFSLVVADLDGRAELPSGDITRVILDGSGILDGEAVAHLTAEDHASWEAFALLTMSADLVGSMLGALDLAVAHARERRQFGRPIGGFQAIQHLLADAYVSVQAARSATEAGAESFERHPAGALLSARVAKAFASRVALEVCEAGMLVHGGMGTTWESLCHVHLRRAVAGAQLLGSEAEQLREISATRLRGGSDAEPAADPAGADFRARLRTWLDSHAPAGTLPEDDDRRAEAQIEWQRRLHAGGWSGVSLPAEYGGGGRPATYDGILAEELGAAGAPPILDSVYLSHVVLLFGDEEQRRRWIPRMISGDDRWCQGFSEPEAGSDLAALGASAVRDGDSWVISGQKTWTSSAEWATHCLVLARTDGDAPRHKGISAFVVPMDAAGLVSRPIMQSTGHAEYSELFFDGVRVPDRQMLGRPGDGWALAMSTVTLERGPADNGYAAKHMALLQRLERLAAERGDATEQRDLARSFVDVEVLRVRVQRSLAERVATGTAGPESSADKLLMVRTEQGLHHLALRFAGSQAVVPEDPDWINGYLHSRAASVYGGTEHIQRTIIAQRVLGLPRG